MPSRRVGEYVRLVSALRHNTPPDHADIAHLDLAIQPLNRLQHLLDEVLRTLVHTCVHRSIILDRDLLVRSANLPKGLYVLLALISC